MIKLTKRMVMFNSKLWNDQRVILIKFHETTIFLWFSYGFLWFSYGKTMQYPELHKSWTLRAYVNLPEMTLTSLHHQRCQGDQNLNLDLKVEKGWTVAEQTWVVYAGYITITIIPWGKSSNIYQNIPFFLCYFDITKVGQSHLGKLP